MKVKAFPATNVIERMITKEEKTILLSFHEYLQAFYLCIYSNSSFPVITLAFQKHKPNFDNLQGSIGLKIIKSFTKKEGT